MGGRTTQRRAVKARLKQLIAETEKFAIQVQPGKLLRETHMEILPYVREKCAIQELLQLPYIGSGGLGFGRKVKMVLQRKNLKSFLLILL